jgi:Fur family ferric uptake transcriptional regulator
MNPDKSIKENLKRCGLKSTRQRCAILEALKQSGQPLTAEQVYSTLTGQNININLSTVYRVLETMAEKNLVSKLGIIGENKTFFEYNTKKHRHYLVCLGCKKILAIENCPLHGFEEKLADQTEYEISGHRLDLYGYCHECKKSKTEK